MGFMNERLSFASDYMEGAHPEILQRLAQTNLEQTAGYGLDIYSDAAREKIRAACRAPHAEVHFLTGGTQTNRTVISALLHPYEGVIAADSGHITVHEAGAVEAGGHKVLVCGSTRFYHGEDEAALLLRAWQKYCGDALLVIVPRHPERFDDAFQTALSLACIAGVFALPLPPGFHERGSFTLMDAVSFTLFAVGIALLCAFLVQGRTVWWTTQWLGWLLAGGVGLTGLALYIESTRHKPMLDWHWMTVPQMLIFAVMGAMARLLTSEQTVGAAGLMGAVGVGSAQMSTFYLIVACGMLAGVVGSLILLDINDIRRPVMVALACFALGAWLEIGVGMQTRPAQLYFSQFIVAFASLLFMGPMMLEGALRALAKSPDHMMSFSAVFGLSQTLGGLVGAAAFSAFLTYRTRDHLAAIAQNLTLSNPALAADIQRNAAALSAILSDPVLLQGRAVSQITAQAGKEASVAAYSDLFALLAAMAAVSTLVAVALWLYRRYYKIDILAAEKAKVFAALGK